MSLPRPTRSYEEQVEACGSGGQKLSGGTRSHLPDDAVNQGPSSSGSARSKPSDNAVYQTDNIDPSLTNTDPGLMDIDPSLVDLDGNADETAPVSTAVGSRGERQPVGSVRQSTSASRVLRSQTVAQESTRDVSRQRASGSGGRGGGGGSSRRGRS
jgi:hypothetical protein